MASWAEATDSEPRRDHERAPDGTPLYVHLPFCASKCHYCDFFSLPDTGQDIDGTLRAILTEAERRAPRNPDTVFFGGGTPSLLSVEQWALFADELQRITGFRDSAREVTAECNPESLDEAKASALLEAGIPRLSIGFQSLRDDRLELFGRVHSVEQSFQAFAAARSAGLDAVNVDLIYALPDQSAESWEGELERVLELRPESFSAYELTYEKETLFHRWREQGRLASAPEDVQLAQFETVRRVADRHGYAPYEISNYALEDRACVHNLNYWHNGTYVGVGPSAVSKVGSTRSGNVRALAPYRRRVESDEDPIHWSESPSVAARLAETWWLGLRMTQGVDPAQAADTAGWGVDENGNDPAIELANRLESEGLLERQGERFRLTSRGLPLGDAVAAEFLKRLAEFEPPELR